MSGKPAAGQLQQAPMEARIGKGGLECPDVRGGETELHQPQGKIHQVTLPEKQPPKILPEKLGRPVTSRPGENIYTRVSSVLESLLNAAENIKS